MNICITTKSLARGGAEVLLSLVIPRLVKHGHNVEVLYFVKNVGDLSSTIKASGAKVIYVGSLGAFSALGTLVKYRQKLVTRSYDVIFEHSPLISSFTRLFGFGSKVIYVEHSVFENYNLLTRLMNKYTYSLINKVICCSDKVFLSNGGVGIVLLNAVDLINRDEIVADNKLDLMGYRVIISVANISRVKNHVMLINAFEKLTFKKVKLLIVGAPRDNSEKLNDAINKSKKNMDIILYGPSSDVYSLLALSDIFCLTSLHEGLPISMLEAMSVGVVPVSTNVGGIPKLLKNNCGFVTNVDDVDTFAKFIDRLLYDELLLDEYSVNAILEIERNYNIESYCNSLIGIFESVYSSNPP